MKFSIHPHAIRSGVEVVEVRDDQGNLLATITPGAYNPNEIRVLSKRLNHVAQEAPGPGSVPGVVAIFLHPVPVHESCGGRHDPGRPCA